MAENLAVLADVHRAYLNDHAISGEVIEAAGIFSLGWDIVFPWQDGDQLTAQFRVWPEPEGGLPDGVPKYRWETGRPLHLWAIRPMDGLPAGAPVIIAEGTKQALAVASWAPPEYAVFGMAGCWGWSHDGKPVTDLARFAGRPVILMLDADAETNLNVYEAGESFATQLELEDAVPGFVPSPAWGKAGIDDYLAGIAPGRRTAKLEKLIARAGPKPAAKKPSHRPVSEERPDTQGRPLVVINRDRKDVIRDILAAMQQRWNGTDLFCYGGALTRLREAATDPLDKDALARWVAEAVFAAKYIPPGMSSPGRYEPTWPDQLTMGALMASGDEFALLNRVSRAPFIRPDGSVCFKPGYDPATATMLVTGNSGMDRLQIPDAPEREDAANAADWLVSEWLGNMPWRDEPSRANALALALTPFIRGLVPLAPLAVVSGLQPGVGKNLLSDCISLMVTGEVSPPLPWIADDDDEMRKQITSAFRAGQNLLCFDEAHVLGGTALTRAITSVTYADRILGLSKQVSWPNQVTWIALGNQVQVNADMARRAYWIELYPDVPDPENRPESDFDHPDLRSWTAANRPELVTAALTVIRSWYAAGCPAYSRGFLMGSFEAWDKIMSGILGHAGVAGFLANLSQRRTERDATGSYWSEHLAWLAAQFGTAEFTAQDVKIRAMASAGTWDAPPRLERLDNDGWTRNLGQAYGRVADRWYGRYRLRKLGYVTGSKRVWVIQEMPEGQVPAELIPPVPPSQLSDDVVQGTPGLLAPETLPELEQRDQMGNAADGILPETSPATPPLQPGDTDPALGFSKPHPGSPGMEGSDTQDGDFFPSRDARAGAGAHAHAHVRGGWEVPIPAPDPSGAPGLAFDLETGDAGELFTYAPHDETGFVRLAGITGASGQTAVLPPADLIALIAACGTVTGHNILGFDGLALAWHHGMDWDEFCARARDTELIARQVFPPRSRESGSSQDQRGLDAVAALLGLPGKTDDLSRLKARHHGYDRIPLDDPEYLAYLDGDLDATLGVAAHLLGYYDADPYLRREHELARIAGHMSLNGFAVDIPLLEQRYAEGEQRKADAMDLLHAGWGLPLGRQVMRGRGKARHEETQEFDSPLATAEGRAWLAQMWARYQVPSPPLTATGQLAIGADVLRPISSDPACPADLRSMLTLMEIITTTRTVYQTAKAYLAPDGRVHPKVSMRQASGRWSVTEPGMTVFGKHGGRHVERDIFIADEGHVLMTFDLRQVDMRAMAGHSQDPAYMAMFAPGRDPHAEIAEQVYGTAEMRQAAKAVGHGWNYGLGPKRMIESGMDPDRVWAFVHGMEARFPQLIAWREDIRARSKAGMILDNGFGRRMLAEPHRAHTVAPALMGQGGARDIMGECLLRLPRELDPFLRVMVHDEQVLSVPRSDAEEVRHVVENAMTWTWRGVPILCDVSGPGRSWGELSAK